MTTFAKIKSELAKRKPEELPLLIRDEAGLTLQFVQFVQCDEEYAVFRFHCIKIVDIFTQDQIGHFKIIPVPKRKKVLYQAVFGIVERIEVSQFLFATEHEAKLFYKECFISLLTDRPIEIEEE